MFPLGTFPPGYFPASYFPKVGSSQGPPPAPPGAPPGLTRTVLITGDPTPDFSLEGSSPETRQLRGSPAAGRSATGNITGGE
jgi:hypothetical protein